MGGFGRRSLTAAVLAALLAKPGVVAAERDFPAAPLPELDPYARDLAVDWRRRVVPRRFGEGRLVGLDLDAGERLFATDAECARFDLVEQGVVCLELRAQGRRLTCPCGHSPSSRRSRAPRPLALR